MAGIRVDFGGVVANKDSNNNSLAEMTFLVVDDSTSMRRIIMRILAGMDCENIFEADSGKKAQEVLAAEHIDFIVCDWNMPGMKGIDLLRAVRATDAHKDIPFLMVSAEVKTENIVEAIQSGVSNYLPKPFTPEILRKKIEVILEARKEGQARSEEQTESGSGLA